MRALVCLLCLPLMLSACAGPSREQCESMDWYATGWETGERGRSDDEYKQLAERCKEFGVEGDRESFAEGYDEGISRYCTYERGSELGRRGADDPGVCPEPYQEVFKAGYDGGLALYCTPENAYQMGRNGGAMNSNCVAVGGEAFRSAYESGLAEYRYYNALAELEQEISYLAGAIHERERRLADPGLAKEDRRVLERQVGELVYRHRQATRALYQMRRAGMPRG